MSHSDHIGSGDANLELSQKLSQSVVNYLVDSGISANRLEAKGYGETMPKKITKQLSEKYSFLNEGNFITESLIKTLTASQQEIARSLNRRTEFRVLSIDYTN